MKRISFIIAALAMSACAHETTTMDRELALKLADNRANVQVVQAAPPVFNVSFNNQGQASGEQPGADDREQCMNSPVYTVTGQFSHYVKRCFGSH